jgi:hypothetical protein
MLVISHGRTQGGPAGPGTPNAIPKKNFIKD